jgi:hypothetical protein
VSYFNLGFKDPVTKLSFSDSSEIVYKGYFISLNLVAFACPQKKLNNNMAAYDGFSINHNAFPYFGYKIDKKKFNEYIKEKYGKDATITIVDNGYDDFIDGEFRDKSSRNGGSSGGSGPVGTSGTGAAAQGQAGDSGAGGMEGEKKEMKFGTKRRRRRSSN